MLPLARSSALPAFALVAFPFALLIPSASLAGPNALGTLILHVRPDYECSQCSENCGDAGISACIDAITSNPSTRRCTWWVFANFPPGAEPRLRGVTFGVDYDVTTPEVVVTNWGHCGDFELANPSWPAPGEGTAVTWDDAQTGLFTEVYWFVGYDYYSSGAQFAVVPHPTQGGFFGDDSIPARLDPIVGYGALGFGGDPGYLPCATGEGAGACCLDDGSCTETTEAGCGTLVGVWMGSGVACDPSPCAPAGACCLPDESCRLRVEEACLAEGGGFRGAETVCFPNPCPVTCEPFLLAGRDGARRPEPPMNPFVRRDAPQTSGTVRSDPGRDGATPSSATSPSLSPAEATASPSASSSSASSSSVSVAASSFASAATRLGPNTGGVLVLHADPAIASTAGDPCVQTSIAGCDEVIAREDGAEPIVLQVLALFPDGSEPELMGVVFGVEYDACVEPLEWDACGDFELADPDWPESGAGTAVTFTAPRTERLVAIYWFEVELDAPEVARIGLIPHPEQGAYFADDSIPAILDPIAGLGAFGFFSPGEVPCQSGVGACCVATGCRVLTSESCFLGGGEYVGDGVPCEPDPCAPVPVIESSWGVIKGRFRE